MTVNAAVVMAQTTAETTPKAVLRGAVGEEGEGASPVGVGGCLFVSFHYMYPPSLERPTTAHTDTHTHTHTHTRTQTHAYAPSRARAASPAPPAEAEAGKSGPGLRTNITPIVQATAAAES
jgi:hypothetical protein